jgi:hypothetical protein
MSVDRTAGASSRPVAEGKPAGSIWNVEMAPAKRPKAGGLLSRSVVKSHDKQKMFFLLAAFFSRCKTHDFAALTAAEPGSRLARRICFVGCS